MGSGLTLGGVLVYKNFPTEGPGLLAEVLDRHGVPYAVAERARGQPFDPRGFDAVVVLGGPQSANDRDAATRRLLASIRGVVAARKPNHGVCLGAQMLARALGAAVTRNPVPEYGDASVRLTPAARRDPLFRGLPAKLPVFQWHGETFGIPEGGQLLAWNEMVERVGPLPGTRTSRERRHRVKCVRQQNQAFRAGRAWGVQFHNEVTPGLVRRWAVLGRNELERAGVEPAALVRGYEVKAAAITRVGERMVDNFLKAAGFP